MKMTPMNEVTINVKCVGTAVTITVDPFQAHVKAGEPMVWHVHANADVDELSINAVGAKWPFTDALPYKSKKNKAAKAKQRKSDWISGDTAQYQISATCKGQRLVLDPDMIVD